jgi:hypothetical protein
MATAQKPTPGRRDRVVGLVLAGIGALVGLVALVQVMSSLPYSPVQSSVIRPNRPGAGSELFVEFFGRPGVHKTSPDPHAFDVESGLWMMVSEGTLGLAAMGLGGWAGWRIGSRLGRRRAAGRVGPDTQAADYDDASAAGPATPPDTDQPVG